MKQGLWEVSARPEKITGRFLTSVKLQGYSLALQPAHLSKERWEAFLGEKRGGCLIPSIPLGGGSAAHQQKVTWALAKAREAMDEDPHPLQSVKRGLVLQEAVVNPELEVRFPSSPRSLFLRCMAGSSVQPERRFSPGEGSQAAGR